MDSCVVCMEQTLDKTACNHTLCKSCMVRLPTETCPYCRQYIKTWEYEDIALPFYYFTEILYEYYRKNSTYHLLKVGIEIPNILSHNTQFVFHNPYGNCPFTENYEKTITIRCFNIEKNGNKIRVEFETPGLDKNSRHFYRSFPDTSNDSTNLLFWILNSRKLRSHYNSLLKN